MATKIVKAAKVAKTAPPAPAAVEPEKKLSAPPKPGHKPVVKKVAPVEKDVVVKMHHSHVNPKAELDVTTGTRFTPKSFRQEAYDALVKAIKAGTTLRKELLVKLNKAGFPAAYFTRVTAAHPERFRVWKSGKVEYIAPKK